MVEFKSEKIYDAGFAVMMYDISTSRCTWRFREETIVTPFGRPWYETDTFGWAVAKIDDVRANAIG